MNLFWYIYKNKCIQYWFENDSVFEVGLCKMQLFEEIMYVFYMLRKFMVYNIKVRLCMYCFFNFDIVCLK